MFGNNGMNQQAQATVIYRDAGANAIYLSNGIIIDLQEFDGVDGFGRKKGNVVQNGVLQNTNMNGVWSIVSKSGKVIGEFVANQGPKYYNNSSNGNMNIGGMGNMGLSTSIDNVVGGSGSISIGGNYNENTNIDTSMYSNNPEPERRQAETPKDEVKVPMLDGYEFLPVPTNYTDLKYTRVGDYNKFEIIIRKDENMNITQNNEVYAGLKESNRENNEATLVALFDSYILDVNDSSSVITAMNIAQTFKNKNIIFNGTSSFWYLTSIKAKSNELTPSDVVYKGTGSSFYVNELADLVSRSSSLQSLLDGIDRMIKDKSVGIPLKNGIVNIINEEYSIVANTINVHPKQVNSLGKVLETIKEYINTSIDDIALREEYDKAEERVFRRLTNPKSLSEFRHSIALALVDPIEKVVTGAGLRENILCASTRDANILVELAKLIDAEEDKSTYKVDINTPNTLKLLTDLLDGNLRYEVNTNNTFKAEKFSSNLYQMVLYVLGSKFKVYRKVNGIFVTRID